MLRRHFSIIIAGLLLAGFGGAAEPPKHPYGMVRLLSLTCHQTDDGIFGGGEEPVIRVAGQQVWETEGARPGKTFDLSKVSPVIFHERCDLALTERDPGNEDKIGTQAVTVMDIAAGKKSAKLEQGGSSYTLAYEVVRAPGRCARLQLHQLKCLKSVAAQAGERDSISVAVDRFTAHHALSVEAGKANQTPLDKWKELTPLAFADAAAVKLHVSTRAPAAKGDKLDPKAVMAANPPNTPLPAQQVLANLAGKGRQRLTFRTAAGAHFEVIFEVLP
ncbi:MAG: hypothetical protein JNM56_02425 [Planctomycetia bacterium]|nr:hypothetical protein [Planctomycetia bacterium]